MDIEANDRREKMLKLRDEILAIEEDGVQVRNSKRVNTLLLEGELKEDRFITDDPQIQTLKDYLP